MKILKIEKWWLILGLGVYALYNIPGVPAYGDARGAVIWNILGFVLMWSINYIFNAKIEKIYKPAKTSEEFQQENYAMDAARAKAEAEWDAQLLAEKAKKKSGKERLTGKRPPASSPGSPAQPLPTTG